MTNAPRHFEAAFEMLIEHHLLGHGYVAISRDGFERERGAIQVIAELVEVLGTVPPDP